MFSDELDRLNRESVDLSTHPVFVEYQKALHAARNGGDTSGFQDVAVGGGGESGGDDEEEITVGKSVKSVKCPLTLKLMEVPMKSKVCGHSYGKEAIIQYIGRARQKKCPLGGE